MEEIFEMATRKGFLTVWWRRLAALRATGSAITYKELYEQMEAEYEASFSSPLWDSYDAFKKYRNRHK